MGVLKGVAVTKVMVGDNREPTLGDAFKPGYKSSWHTHKDFGKEFFAVGYSFCQLTAGAASELESPRHHKVV